MTEESTGCGDTVEVPIEFVLEVANMISTTESLWPRMYPIMEPPTEEQMKVAFMLAGNARALQRTLAPMMRLAHLNEVGGQEVDEDQMDLEEFISRSGEGGPSGG